MGVNTLIALLPFYNFLNNAVERCYSPIADREGHRFNSGLSATSERSSVIAASRLVAYSIPVCWCNGNISDCRSGAMSSLNSYRDHTNRNNILAGANTHLILIR